MGVDEVNTRIRELWKDKLTVMAEIKGARGELAKSHWEQRRLQMTFEDLTEKTREFQLQRVTKSLQELIKSGQGVEARKEAEISTLERFAFNEVVARKRLVDIAKAQAEEIEFLREELTRLLQRTFPSFSHISNNTR